MTSETDVSDPEALNERLKHSDWGVRVRSVVRTPEVLPFVVAEKGVTLTSFSSTVRPSAPRAVKVLPRFGPSLWASILPPCISASFCTMVSPMPKPPSLRAMERSPCAKS